MSFSWLKFMGIPRFPADGEIALRGIALFPAHINPGLIFLGNAVTQKQRQIQERAEGGKARLISKTAIVGRQLHIVGGQENHDGVRVLGLYQLAQLKTVAVWQVDVQQHQIKFPLADGVGCGSGI